ncbi:MAG: acyl-CoA dehydrogenase family protein [Pseudomonadales bacterium]
MDLSLSEEQQLLKQSVASFVRDNYSVDLRRKQRDTDIGFDRYKWRQFAELGWLSLPFSEEDGGVGGNVLDMMVVMEELGRGLVVEPYLVNIAICGGFLARSNNPQRSRYLQQIMAGESQWGFAFAEPTSRYNLASISVSATADDSGYQLSGKKISVLNGHVADYFIVSARTDGGSHDHDGISLFIVEASKSGLTRREYPLVDGSHGADVSFNKVSIGSDALLGEPAAGRALMEDVIAEAIVAMGAEAVGAMDALLEQTVEYTTTREQFGQPIGRFQALQHRMAEMYLQCHSLRSLLYHAAITRAEKRPDSIKAASALKVKLGEAGRFVSQQALQLHGGMGMTDELAVGHYLKRLLLLNILFGDSEHHLKRYTQL